MRQPERAGWPPFIHFAWKVSDIGLLCQPIKLMIRISPWHLGHAGYKKATTRDAIPIGDRLVSPYLRDQLPHEGLEFLFQERMIGKLL